MTDTDCNEGGVPIPPLGDPDRKRVLGVLAQRRYRQRLKSNRQKQAASKNSATTSAGNPSSSSCDSSTDSARQSPQTYHEMFAEMGLEMPDFLPDLGFPRSESETAFLGDMVDQLLPDNLLSTSLQDLETTSFSFPDDRSIEVPVLKLLRTAIDIATALGCIYILWDPMSSHVVDPSSSSTLILPRQFQPVDAQLRIPHHPVLDILPWPSVRSKLIQAFALPMDLRPPAARDQLAIVNLVYDIEDEREGCRIAGSDGMDAARWEVGQKMFRNWWWALDRDVIEQSNALRAHRGADRLTLDSP